MKHKKIEKSGYFFNTLMVELSGLKTLLESYQTINENNNNK